MAPWLVALLLWSFPRPVAAEETFAVSEVWVETSSGRHHFTVELADTAARQAQGLMFREAMAADHGMLFLFARPKPATFWMRNTLIPLDMLFLDGDGTIVNIIERAEPRTDTMRPSQGPVAAVLEINGGLSDLLGIEPGDKVVHPFFAD